MVIESLKQPPSASSTKMAMTIPKSRFNQFQYKRELGTRWGQQFYEFMELHKVTDPFDKLWCDKLYEANHILGRQMVLIALDHNN